METTDKAKVKRNICEYYNFILLGLVKELIDLGAGQDLKRTVLILWHRYLELLNNGTNLNELQTFEEKSTKKRKRSQQVVENDTTVVEEDPTDIIIIDEETDDEDKLTAPNNETTNNSAGQSKSSDVFHRRKMYAIIYLAMLINKDRIQLGDMLRFLKEGHLSYNWLEHFFPEEFNVNVITSRHVRPVTNFFTAKCMRELAHRLASFLNVTSYVPTQNLVGLCERYCEELNLPEAIQNYISTLISSTLPQMEYAETNQVVPNYEARAVSLIVFTLKLLFGLDAVTEYRLSNLKSENCFNFRKWLNYIIYRKLIVCHQHFPTSYGSSNLTDCYLYSKYAKDYYSKLTSETADRDFVRLFEETSQNCSKCRFHPTLTPMQDYLKLALERVNTSGDNLILDIVMENFRHTSVDFLFNPHKYTDLQVKWKHAGANKNIKFVPLFDTRPRYRKEKYNCRKSSSTSNTKELSDLQAESTLNHSELLDSFRKEHKQTFQQRTKTFEKGRNSNAAKNKYYHYNCDEQFWLSTANEAGMTRLEFEDYFKTLPYTFQLIVVECSGMINQTVRDVMIEYNVTETSMAYVLRENSQALSSTFNLPKVAERSKKLW